MPTAITNDTLPAPREPLTVLELLLVLVACLAGVALRTWHFGDLGLSHFDEGVYAFSGLGLSDPSQPYRLFPDQQRFSPPIYFSLVALANLLGVDPSRSPFVVNAVVGSVTIPVVWWLGRQWLGGAAAAAASMLLALSEFHILMTRSALTDTTFLLAFLLALAAVVAAIDRQTIRSGVIAGLATGVAWNVKYHGWFALVVGLMVVLGRWRMQRMGWAWARGAVRTGLIATVVAVLCYVPWAWHIQSQPGSSTGWVAYFQTMLQTDWLASMWRHVEQQLYVEGPWSRASVPAAFAWGQLVAAAQGRRVLPWWTGLVLAASALLIGAVGTLAALTIVAGVIAWQRGPRPPELMLASVVLLWIIMAPVYRAYLRLLMPLSLAMCLMGGSALTAQLSRVPSGTPGRTLAVAAAAAVGTWLIGSRLADPSDPWRRGDALARGADTLSAHLPAGAPVRVVGEPGLAFHLHRLGHPAFGRNSIESIDTASAPGYLITGIYLRRAPRLRDNLDARRDRVQLVARVHVVPTDVRILDDFRPDSARRWIQRPDSTYDLLLWRYMPVDSTAR